MGEWSGGLGAGCPAGVRVWFGEAAKGGLCEALAADAAAGVARLAAAGAASLAGGAGLEAAELAIRTAVMELGRSVLEPLLAADGGYRGPRVDCGGGHQARFVSYRGKTVDTVLGPVTISRAWYHCAQCEHGLAPRDGELGAGRVRDPGQVDQAAWVSNHTEPRS
ncbi:MAG TPA: hypothetical protein VMV92_38360 [Streptosporangiaceae bacterium]|nr:hypothetical protein [Streptosporangiaceae bacterium]